MTTYLASMADQRRGVAEFAAKMHLDIAPRNLRQRIPGLPITFRDDRDRDTAIIRLTEAKNAEIEASAWKRIFILNSARGTRFSRKDVAAQLQSAVKSPRNLGLVEVLRDMLLAQQGDINYLRQRSSGWISLFVRPFQHEKRSQILASAAETGDISLVQLLVHHSDQSSLDEALELALPRSRNDRDLFIPELLLAHGAHGSCQDEFLEAAVATHNTCLLELLIHAPKPVSREILSRNLLLAVRTGFIDTLFALVLAGADGNGSDGTGAAVKEAVKKGRQDILEALTLCDPAPTSQNLDEAVNIAYSKWIDEPLRQGTLMEILLKNGARGLYSDSTLLAISTHCVTQPSSPINSSLKAMMDLLVCHNASINHDNAAALNLCVSRTRIDLIDILLRSRHLDSNLASKAFSQIDSTASPQQNLEIASKLLQRGAHGRPLHEALTYAVATNHIGTIKLLLSRSNPNRASVDYQGAQALKDAVSREKIPIVDILLEAAPTNQSLSQTFPHIRKASKEGRFQLSKSFFKQGVQGLEVDRALSEAISDGPPMRDERLLQLLVDHRAAVDPHICSIVSRGDEILLRILLKGRPSVQVTSKAVLKALQLPEEDRRLSSICLLMNAGANINYDHGKAIFEATRSFQLPSLDLLLQFSPKPSSLNAAFASTTAMKDIERRYEYTRRLLKAGATGDEVHKALVAAVATTTPNLDLLKLIIPYASIDFEDGRALCLAIQKLLQQHVLLLLKMKPNSVSFSNGFSAARSLRDVQMELRFHKLLLAAGPEERVVSQTLLNAVEDQKTEVSRLLLKHGASTDFENGSSVVTAVTSTNALILKLLLGNSIRKPSVATVTTGFNAALRLRNGRPKQEILDIILNTGVKRDSRNNALLNFVKSDNPDCSTISTLLKHGASVYFNKNESLLVAAKRGNIEVLNLLFQFTNDTSVVSLVFADRFKDASFYTSRLGLCIMEMLLKNGAKGNQVNQALIKATEDYEKQSLAKDFAFILLQYGADVNFMNGNALQIAAGMGINATNLIVEILKKDCNAETLSLALPYLINSGNAVESTVTALIKQFASHRNQRFRKPFVHPEFSQPVIVLCFENFPRGLNLLMAVLDAGFPPDQTWQCRYGEQQVEITPLFWVLSKPDGVVDNILIEHLISRGAALHNHPESLIHLSIAANRSTVVQSMINSNIELDVKDHQYRTPLAHASEIGADDCVKALIAAKVEVNDGALHLAARTLNVNTIKMLINNGHSPNQRSSKHQGRTSLAELCLWAPKYAKRSTSAALEKDARKATRMLMEMGAKTKLKIPNQESGRSLLLHALDSAKPLEMARAFLDCGQDEYINDDFNLFTDREYTYSPTKYVQKGLCRCDPKLHARLIRTLKEYGAEDRYWKNKGEQPGDMINPPDDIQKEHNAREAERERRIKLREKQDYEAAMKVSQQNAELERKYREYEFQKSQEEDQRDRELQYRVDENEIAFQSASRKAHLRQWGIESKGQAAINRAQAMGEIEINLGHQRNRQNLAFEDGMYERRERQWVLDERAWASEERVNRTRIELGRETRRVAAMEIEYETNSGRRRALAQRRSDYGQLANRNRGRITEI